MTTMPAAFFGHGSPMNALETNRYTEGWAAYGRGLARPDARSWRSRRTGSSTRRP